MGIRMHNRVARKELHDPFAHYVRGVLFCDDEGFKFIAHRAPYVDLNRKTWDSEQAFMADYRRTIASKYLP